MPTAGRAREIRSRLGEGAGCRHAQRSQPQRCDNRPNACPLRLSPLHTVMNSSMEMPASSAALPREMRCSRNSSSAISFAAERDGCAPDTSAALKSSWANSTLTVLIESLPDSACSTNNFRRNPRPSARRKGKRSVPRGSDSGPPFYRIGWKIDSLQPPIMPKSKQRKHSVNPLSSGASVRCPGLSRSGFVQVSCRNLRGRFQNFSCWRSSWICLGRSS